MPDLATSLLSCALLPLTVQRANAFDPEQMRDEAGRWTAEGTGALRQYQFAAEPVGEVRGGRPGDMSFYALHRGKKIGELVIGPSESEPGRLYVAGVKVDPAYQRKGVATHLYDLAHQHFGHLNLTSGNWRSAEGRAFRSSYDQSHAAAANAYVEGEARDAHGRWTAGGMSVPAQLVLRPHAVRAWRGAAVALSTRLSRLETGALGERVAAAYVRRQGYRDVRSLNMRGNNFPVDLMQDHEVIEVKTGLASNGPSAQHWRATIGQPGVKEQVWLAEATPAQKAAWNARKGALILQRKQRAVADFARQSGHPVRARTLGVILNPDARTADVYEFAGFHLRLGWHGASAEAGYRGTFCYE